MSLTAIYQPTGILPVNNPVPLVISSSFSAQAGFRYKIELLDYSDTTKLEVWVYPDTDNSNYGIYDFSMPLSDLITSDLDNWNCTGITLASSSYYRFKWKVTEYIGGTSGETLASSSPLHVFRGVKQYENKWERQDYIPGSYTLLVPWDGSLASFLSNKNEREYSLTEYATLNTLFGSFTADISIWDKMIVEVHRGASTTKYYTPIVDPNTNFFGGGVYTLPIGPAQLNIMGLGGALSGYTTGTPTSAAILDADDDYYEIWIESGSTQFTEKVRINLDHNCYKHEGVEFLWLGDLSTYETYTARYGSEKSFKTDRNEVKSNYYGLSGGVYGYNFGDRGRKNINVRTNESRSVYTDWIKDEEAQDLMELFRSPDVYIIKDDEIYPIIITTTSYIEKTVKNDRLFNYKIDFQMAYEKLSNV